MTRRKEIVNQLTGEINTTALIQMMKATFEDFVQMQHQYEQAMCALKKELGDEPVNTEESAIFRQIASSLFFSGMLGMKANLDNFLNPIARSFLEVDSDIYLREHIAHSLPEYEAAQQIRDAFYAKLTPLQKETYSAITTYAVYLQTTGTVLAHYYGYLLGNELLPHLIPCYRFDPVQTIRYRRMLEEHFGKQIP